MLQIADLIFFTGVACIFSHELDAVLNREWRLLPILNRLDDERGYIWFTALHVPLFAVIFLFLDNRAFQIGADWFLILHACAHWLLRKHPQYEFDSLLSKALIFGAALFGLIHLLVCFLAL